MKLIGFCCSAKDDSEKEWTLEHKSPKLEEGEQTKALVCTKTPSEKIWSKLADGPKRAILPDNHV